MTAVAVYYFEEPTIGYCRKCEVTAVYMDGLQCPKCGSKDITLFVWDGSSTHPEQEDDEDE